MVLRWMGSSVWLWWRSGGMVGGLSCAVAERGMTERRGDGVVEWLIGAVVEWLLGVVVEWLLGAVVERSAA